MEAAGQGAEFDGDERVVVDAAIDSWRGWVAEAGGDLYHAHGELRQLLRDNTEYGAKILERLARSDDEIDRVAALEGLEELQFLDCHANTLPVLRLLYADEEPDISSRAHNMTRLLRHGEGPSYSFTVRSPHDCWHNVL